MERDNYWTRLSTRRLGRRRLIGGASFAALGLAAAATVGCGDDDDDDTSDGGATSTGTTAATGTSAASPTSQAKKGGKLVVGGGTMLGQFEPNASTSAADWALLFALYDTLFVTDNTGAVKPNLATSYEAKDGQVSLKLRSDVKFHDGTPFNATAVKRNVERTLGLGTKSRVYSQWSQVETVTVPDETTVVFKLKQPQYGPIVANMATIAGAMPSPDAIEKLGQDFNSKPVGTGPYKIDQVALDSRITTTANKEYWGTAAGKGPHMDGIEYKIVATGAALVTAMQAGEVDIIHYSISAPAGEIIQLKAISGVEVLQLPSHSFTEFRLNRGKAPFDNADLLKALGYALDRDAILAGNHGGFGKPAGGPINPATWAYNPNFKGFNLPKAEREAKVKEHLQKGGSPSGFAFTFKLAGSTERAETIKQMVKPYGIDVTIEVLPATAGTQYLYDGDFQATPSFTPQYSPDPDSIFRPNFHSAGQFNYHRFKSDALDQLIDQAAAETDQAKRKDLYWQAQDMIFDLGIPRIPNVHVDILVPMKTKVKNLQVGWDTYMRVGDVWLDG
ncbi:MAG: ABC transporter substrate-binding protein [Dehalococcoidia bacterium]|nr:ABC transporter substrate-binding protein [Dehalococcoidia bacterium]